MNQLDEWMVGFGERMSKRIPIGDSTDAKLYKTDTVFGRKFCFLDLSLKGFEPDKGMVAAMELEIEASCLELIGGAVRQAAMNRAVISEGKILWTNVVDDNPDSDFYNPLGNVGRFRIVYTLTKKPDDS